AEDAGLRMRDIDGLLCATTQNRTSGLNLSEYLGISPRFIDTTILGGSSFEFHVAHAVAALQLGLCEVAAIAYGSTQRTVGRRQASVREVNPFAGDLQKPGCRGAKQRGCSADAVNSCCIGIPAPAVQRRVCGG